jgi:RNA polymerase sigma-70 factor (ECF subfamily)
MDDDELIARVARGDDVALRELFSRHAPWLAARLRAVLPAADVEDVLQETFLAVWRTAGGYRPQDAGGGWTWRPWRPGRPDVMAAVTSPTW